MCRLGRREPGEYCCKKEKRDIHVLFRFLFCSTLRVFYVVTLTPGVELCNSEWDRS